MRVVVINNGVQYVGDVGSDPADRPKIGEAATLFDVYVLKPVFARGQNPMTGEGMVQWTVAVGPVAPALHAHPALGLRVDGFYLPGADGDRAIDAAIAEFEDIAQQMRARAAGIVTPDAAGLPSGLVGPRGR